MPSIQKTSQPNIKEMIAMVPILQLISAVVDLLNMGLFVYVIMGLLISFEVINGYQPIVSKVMFALKQLYEPMLRPIRKIIPDLGGLDISPVILFLLFNFAENLLQYYGRMLIN
jgi:YggT family protein